MIYPIQYFSESKGFELEQAQNNENKIATINNSLGIDFINT